MEEMRPYSEYLDILKAENFAVDAHLAGSTPPLPPLLAKKSLRLSLNTDDYPRQLKNLKSRLARMTRSRPDEIQFMPGSTQACFQALAALTEPGQTVAIEHPGYEPYLAAARFLGLNVIRYERSTELRTDLEQIRARNPDVMIISNPHCPTGGMYNRSDFRLLKDLKMSVIVDEVFLPLFGGGLTWRPAVGETKNIVFLSGLSKSTGMGFARSGWTISHPEVAKRIYQLGMHMHLDFPAPLVEVTDFALNSWRAVTAHLLKISNANRKVVLDFLKRHPGSLSHDFRKGFFAMLKAPDGMISADFCAEMMKHKIFLRDGALFEMPGWVRFHNLFPTKPFNGVFQKIASHYDT